MWGVIFFAFASVVAANDTEMFRNINNPDDRITNIFLTKI